MASYPGLPEDFDPENYARKPRSLEDTLDEGVTVLQVVAAKRSANAGITCWSCHQRPDGEWDCFRISCPDSWPQPTHLEVKEQ
jgi:hypothetical protein